MLELYCDRLSKESAVQRDVVRLQMINRIVESLSSRGFNKSRMMKIKAVYCQVLNTRQRAN